jgi:hypothetical protein
MPDRVIEMIIKTAAALISGGAVYVLLLFPMLWLYPRYSWARTAANSGLFTKFPIAHKAVLNTRWARRYLFLRFVSQLGPDLPEPYIPQRVAPARDRLTTPFQVDGGAQSLRQLFAGHRRILLMARSGTGKSVFLRHLRQQVARRFVRAERVPIPVLIDLRTHVLKDRQVRELVRDALSGGGVELAESEIDFLLRKGGFLILFDSLNELPDPADAQLFHTFFNQYPNNRVVIASQVDLIRRDELRVLGLAEPTLEQAAQYFDAASAGVVEWKDLPSEAQALARNPQDLALLVEIAEGFQNAARAPTRRAALYRDILNQDGSLRAWVESGDPLLSIIYAVAFRMVLERHLLQEDELREWIATETRENRDATAKVLRAMQASRLFRKESERDVLGKEREVLGFRHELIGKFLASRHLHQLLGRAPNVGVNFIPLAGDELWLDVFYFLIDEIGSVLALNQFLSRVLAAGGRVRVRIVAYAIGSRPAEWISGEVREGFDAAKLDEDLALTSDDAPSTVSRLHDILYSLPAAVEEAMHLLATLDPESAVRRLNSVGYGLAMAESAVATAAARKRHDRA